MATVPNPRTWTTLYNVQPADLNLDLRDAVNFLLDPPAAQVYNSAGTTISNATYTAIQFDTAIFNTDTTPMWASGTNTRVTVQTAGTYRISGQVAFANNGTGVREAQFTVNGTAVQTFNVGAVAGVASQVVIPAFEIHLNAGDYIIINAYQNSGGALALSGGAQSTFLLVEYARNI